MEVKSLDEIYSSLDARAKIVYVVPLIRYTHKQTDYLYLLYKDLIKSEKYDIKTVSVYHHFKLVTGILRNNHAILHYHWLEFQDFKSLLGMPWKILCIFLFRLFGGKIVWTLHNEFPHDQKYLRFHSYLHQKMADWSEKLHVHCKTAVGVMMQRLNAPEEKFFVHPHPKFPSTIQSKSEAIALLNEEYEVHLQPNTPMLLMFGNISRYKQITEVAEIVLNLTVETKLLVVGPIKKGNFDLYKELKEMQQNSERIVIIPRFIPEEHVPWFYNAADLCVFNYREILSSGGVHLALSYQKPIVSPNKGCISELEGKPNVHMFENQEELKLLLPRVIKFTDD